MAEVRKYPKRTYHGRIIPNKNCFDGRLVDVVALAENGILTEEEFKTLNKLFYKMQEAFYSYSHSSQKEELEKEKERIETEFEQFRQKIELPKFD